MSILTPNMNLVVSTVNVDSGLQWENNLNASLTIIDAHDHSPGNGVQIGSSGININGDFPLNGNNLTLARSLRLQVQPSALSLPADLGCLYVSGVDLYYNDENGNQIKMTAGGAVNATSSGISSGSATASFVSSVLVVNAASNTPANIQGGSLLLGNNVASSKFLTLSPPSAMAANYSLTLPALPAASGSFMTMDTSGNMSAVTVVDNSTIQVSSNTISVKASGITATQIAAGAVGTTQLADGSVTRAKIVSPGIVISGSSGAFGTSSTTLVDVTNLTATITTTGNPVFLQLEFDGVGPSNGTVNCINSPGNLRILSGATPVAGYIITRDTILPCSIYSFTDTPSAGTYTYKVQVQVVTPAVSGVVSITSTRLIAYEAL